MSEQNPYGPPSEQNPSAQHPFGPPPAAPAPAPGYGYGQVPPPGYPQQQPGEGWAGYGYPVAPPKKSRKGLWITLGCVVGAVAIAGGVLVYNVADTVSKLGSHKIVLPDSFQQLDSDVNNTMAKQLQDSMTSSADASKLTGTFSTVYHKGTSGRVLVVYGGTGSIAVPSVEEKSFWDGFEASAKQNGATISPRQHPSPGPLGGTMSCENAITTAETDAVCAWIDNSTMVVMLQTTTDGQAPTLEKAAQDARDLRAIAEIPK